MVDTLGLLLGVMVTSADVGDRADAQVLLHQVADAHHLLALVWADGGYTGSLVEHCLAALALVLAIVKHPSPSLAQADRDRHGVLLVHRGRPQPAQQRPQPHQRPGRRRTARTRNGRAGAAAGGRQLTETADVLAAKFDRYRRSFRLTNHSPWWDATQGERVAVTCVMISPDLTMLN